MGVRTMRPRSCAIYVASVARRNDIIVSVNGEDIHTLEELQAVYERCLEEEAVGKKFTVAVIRSGRRMQQIITLLGEDEDNEEDYE